MVLPKCMLHVGRNGLPAVAINKREGADEKRRVQEKQLRDRYSAPEAGTCFDISILCVPSIPSICCAGPSISCLQYQSVEY